jgi:hypothetical protein
MVHASKHFVLIKREALLHTFLTLQGFGDQVSGRKAGRQRFRVVLGKRLL